MAKRKTTLKVRIPPYGPPRNEWRKKIRTAVRKVQNSHSVSFGEQDLFELDIRLYIKSPALTAHDVDNRLKDIMDALQSRVGGPKGKKPRAPIIENDRQVHRVVIEKVEPPKQARGEGHLIIRKWKKPAWMRRG